MPGVKGKTNNPNGAPLKARTLTYALKMAGKKTVIDVRGQRVGSKRLLAQYVWELATTGKVMFPDGRTIRIDDVEDFVRLAQWLYNHIDGPPKSKVELETKGDRTLTVVFAGTYANSGDTLAATNQTGGAVESGRLAGTAAGNQLEG